MNEWRYASSPPAYLRGFHNGSFFTRASTFIVQAVSTHAFMPFSLHILGATGCAGLFSRLHCSGLFLAHAFSLLFIGAREVKQPGREANRPRPCNVFLFLIPLLAIRKHQSTVSYELICC